MCDRHVFYSVPPRKSLVRKQALRQGCSLLFCGVSSQISSYVRMRLASTSPLSPPDQQQHPAAENLTGPHACIALLRYSRELPRLLLYFS